MMAYTYNKKVLQRYWGVWLALLVAIVVGCSPREEGQLLAPPEELVLRIEGRNEQGNFVAYVEEPTPSEQPLYIGHIAGFDPMYTPEEIFVIQVKKLTWKKSNRVEYNFIKLIERRRR